MAYSDSLHAGPQPQPQGGRFGTARAPRPYVRDDAPFRGMGEITPPGPFRGGGRRSAPWPGSRGWLMLGRFIFGGYFVYSGMNHFTSRGMMTAYARSKGVPLAEIAVAGTGTMLVIGGLSLLAGRRPKVGASLIAAFLLGVSPKMHDFWAIEDQEQRMQELINFMKNMALVGGASFAAALPEPWPASLPAADLS